MPKTPQLPIVNVVGLSDGSALIVETSSLRFVVTAPDKFSLIALSPAAAKRVVKLKAIGSTSPEASNASS
jgi:hypothetical protein